jgi:hypothetical protein
MVLLDTRPGPLCHTTAWHGDVQPLAKLSDLRLLDILAWRLGPAG